MNQITINGQQYPFRVTFGGMMRYKNLTGKDVKDIAADDMEGLLMFFWCCTAAACNADGVEFKYDLQRFEDSLTIDDINRMTEISDEGVKKK